MPAPSQTSPTQPNPILRLTSILVPTDFSSESFKALRYAIAFARQFNATISLLHVVEPPPPAIGFEGVPIAIDETPLIQDSERRLAAFAAENIPSEIKSDILVRHGSAFEQVIATARGAKIDLIAASTHGHTGLKRVLFGSTAERIVQRAPCPMLVVREQEHEFVGTSADSRSDSVIRLKRILVPIDFSDCSRKAFQYAAAFAAQFNAEILCLHALEIPYAIGEGGLVIETEVLRKQLHENAIRHAAAFLKEQAVRPSEDCIVALGTPYREIIQTANDRDVDLIILGTHGRSGVRHFLLGSTTERVVRHAHCPVLIVRERENEFIAQPGQR